MIHFIYLLIFSLATAIGFGIFSVGDTRQKLLHGCKVFAQFTFIGLTLGWLCYFLPW